MGRVRYESKTARYANGYDFFVGTNTVPIASMNWRSCSRDEELEKGWELNFKLPGVRFKKGHEYCADTEEALTKVENALKYWMELSDMVFKRKKIKRKNGKA